VVRDGCTGRMFDGWKDVYGAGCEVNCASLERGCDYVHVPGKSARRCVYDSVQLPQNTFSEQAKDGSRVVLRLYAAPFQTSTSYRAHVVPV
jgi:hypothetical protein